MTDPGYVARGYGKREGDAKWLLKKREGDHWQAAIEALIMEAEDRGPLLHARVGMLRALNHHVERVFNPDRKDTHSGHRKLARER